MSDGFPPNPQVGSGTPPDPWSGPGAEAKAEFLLRLRAKGIRDLDLLRALESVPREIFVPHRYGDLAAKNIALPIPCGQTMSDPLLVARMIGAMMPLASCRVLEIGAGSGYASAVLARLAGEVLAVDRYRSLAVEARARLESLALVNVSVVWADGLGLGPETGMFDRILVHAELPALLEALVARLAPVGSIVYARPSRTGETAKQVLVRAARDADGRWSETAVGSSRLRRLEPGLSQGL